VNLRTGSVRRLDALATGAQIAADNLNRVAVTWLHGRSGGRGPVQSLATATNGSTAGTIRRLTGKGEQAAQAPVLSGLRSEKGFRAAWVSRGGKIRATRR